MIIRTLARPMLASMFVFGGADSVLHPDPKSERAESVVPAARKLPVPLPEDPAMLVRINGAVQVVAGTMLALNKLPRTSATVLAASLAFTTYAGHPFWAEEKDSGARKAQLQQFFKNTSMMGGLLMTAAAPSPKLHKAAWETKGVVKGAGKAVKAPAKGAGKAGKAAKSLVS